MPTAARRRRGLTIAASVAVAVAVVLVAAAIGVTCVRLWDHAGKFVQEIGAIAAEVERVREQPSASLDVMQRHLAAARRELKALRLVAEPVASGAGWLADRQIGGPWPGQVAGAWRFADAGTALGEHLAAAARLGLDGASAGPVGLAGAQPELLRELRAAEAGLALAAAARADLGSPSWPLDRLGPMLARWDAESPRLADALAQADRLVEAAPLAMGVDRPRTYLVLAQTSDDLRATGGFISSVGVVTVEQGRVTGFYFEKVYAAEGIEVPSPADATAQHVTPPAPLGLYMGLGEWRLRDANWWADFPSTARQAATFWEALRGSPVDGVIAFDEAALETLLRAVGPVTLDDGTVVSAENLRDVTLGRVFQGDEPSRWYAAQSTFSRDLARQIIATAERLEPGKMVELGRALQEASGLCDLMVASFDPRLAALARTYGMDGALLGGPTDSVYVVEQNVSYGKLSPFIHQSLEYTVQLDEAARPQRALITLDVANEYAPGRGRPGYPSHYYNGMRWDPEARRMIVRPGFYGGYTRIFVPLGSRVLGISGFDEGVSVGTEGGRTVIGGYVGLDMGARRRIQVEITPVEAEHAPGQYRLLLQRQPGAPRRDVTLRVQMPEGTRTVSAVPEPVQDDARGVVWRGSLDHDLRLELTIAATASPH